jgi:hypothetical protein
VNKLALKRENKPADNLAKWLNETTENEPKRRMVELLQRLQELLLIAYGTPQWIAVFERVCDLLSYFEHPLQIMLGTRSMMRRVMTKRDIIWKGFPRPKGSTRNPNDWEWTWYHLVQLKRQGRPLSAADACQALKELHDQKLEDRVQQCPIPTCKNWFVVRRMRKEGKICACPQHQQKVDRSTDGYKQRHNTCMKGYHATGEYAPLSKPARTESESGARRTKVSAFSGTDQQKIHAIWLDRCKKQRMKITH